MRRTIAAITAIHTTPLKHVRKLDGRHRARVVEAGAAAALGAGSAVPAIELSAADDGGLDEMGAPPATEPHFRPTPVNDHHGIADEEEAAHDMERAAGSASASALDDPRQQYLLGSRDRRTNRAKWRQLAGAGAANGEVLRRSPRCTRALAAKAMAANRRGRPLLWLGDLESDRQAPARCAGCLLYEGWGWRSARQVVA